MEYFDENERPLSQKELKKRAIEKFEELKSDGRDLNPVRVKARGNLAKSFWGREWARAISQYEDMEYRLPKGRSLLRADSVLDLKTDANRLTGLVLGEELFEVSISLAPFTQDKFQIISEKVQQNALSVLDLIESKLPDDVMEFLMSDEGCIFPEVQELQSGCNCTDYADLCEHAAALLYAVAPLFDDEPLLFFKLRGIKPEEFLKTSKKVAADKVDQSMEEFSAGELSDIFGADIDVD